MGIGVFLAKFSLILMIFYSILMIFYRIFVVSWEIIFVLRQPICTKHSFSCFFFKLSIGLALVWISLCNHSVSFPSHSLENAGLERNISKLVNFGSVLQTRKLNYLKKKTAHFASFSRGSPHANHKQRILTETGWWLLYFIMGF